MKNANDKTPERIVGAKGNTLVLLDLQQGTLKQMDRSELKDYSIKTGQVMPLQRQLRAMDNLTDSTLQVHILYTSCHYDWNTRKPTCIMLALITGDIVNLSDALKDLESFNVLEREYLKRLAKLQEVGVRGVYFPDERVAFDVASADELKENVWYRTLSAGTYFIPLLNVGDNSLIPVINYRDDFYISSVFYDNAESRKCLPICSYGSTDMLVYWYHRSKTCLKLGAVTAPVLKRELGLSKHGLSDKAVYYRLCNDIYSRSFNQVEYMLYNDLINVETLMLIHSLVSISELTTT